MSSAYKRGRIGEDLALQYLCAKGYGLLQRNFRIRGTQALSEIDLVFLVPKMLRQSASLQEKVPATLRGELSDFAQGNMTGKGKDILKSRLTKLFASYNRQLLLVFVEVKNWQAYTFSDLDSNLTQDRQQRLLKTAECFLQQNALTGDVSWCFDLILLEGRSGTLRHIEAAFP